MSEAAMEVVDLGNFPVDEATPVVSGPRGKSAYEVAVANGFVGTEAEWLASLAAAGAVSSVNALTGDVVLDAADVGAETPAGAQGKVDTHAADTTDVHGIADTSVLATTGDVSAASTADRARGNHTGTQTSATISDFTEAVQDAVAALLTSGTNVTLTYDDAANSLTVTAATGGDAEVMRDTIGAALVGVGNVAVTVNDAADTITISTTATVNSTDSALRDRSTHTGTQPVSTITGLATVATTGAYADLSGQPAPQITDSAGAPAAPTDGALWVDNDAGAPPVAASDVTFTPTGTIAATTVQDAIAEVASEAGGGGGGAGTYPITRVAVGTATNPSTTNTTYTTVDSTTDVTIPAAAGDKLLIAPNGRFVDSGTVLGWVDAVTVVAGSTVNYCSGRGSTGFGWQNWLRDSINSRQNLGGPMVYTVQSGDVSGGNVTIRLVYRANSTGAVPMQFATGTTEKLINQVMNLGPN